jgi:imidazolonepropionase-like amidohydrolase
MTFDPWEIAHFKTMKINRTMHLLRIVGFLLAGSLLQAEPPVIFTGATLIDGVGQLPVEDATLVIQDGRIVAVGRADAEPYTKQEDAKVISCRGKTIMPTLISDHSHLGVVKDGKISPDNYTEKNIEAALRQYEGYGVTAVLSLGVNKDLLYHWRERQRAGEFEGAEVFTADRGLGVQRAAPPIPVGEDQIARPKTSEEARRIVQEMAARHPDIIKIWVDDFFGATEPKMPPEIYGAIIDEAHKHGLRVAAHIFHLEDGKSLLRRGLDVVAHSVRDQPVDQEFIDLMKKNRAAYIATLTLDEAQFIYAEHPAWMDTAAFRSAVEPGIRESWLTTEYVSKINLSPLTKLNKAALAQGLKNVKTLHDAGVLVGFGTDSGATPARLPGWAEHRELQLLVEAGLTPLEAIQCATRNAAEVLGDLKNRGTLERGKRADFLILDADPLADIRRTTQLAAIYHGGKPIEPMFQEESALRISPKQ